MRRLLLGCLLVLSAAGTGCLTSTQATRLQTDLEEVKKQLFQIQQTSAGNRSKLDELGSQVTGQSPAGPPGQNDLKASLQALLDQNRAMAEQIEDLKARVSALSHQIQTMGGVKGTQGSAPATRPAAGNAPAATGSGSADPAFNAAYADYAKGNYELAVMGFSDFLKSRSDAPLASDAQYWIGECLYSQGKFKEAVEAFDLVASRYPGATRVPAALLKKGLSQIQTGQSSQGVTTLQTLIETQPQTEEARLAAERLQQMGLRSR
ncbi:MAG: tol-pal system protein YbgF [Candidatus Polarisedimenticolia bacterium]